MSKTILLTHVLTYLTSKMTDYLLAATALRTENSMERVIYSSDISNMIKEEGELVLKLWHEEVEATSKCLDGRCFQKLYEFIVQNLGQKKGTQDNLHEQIEAAFNACPLSKDLPAKLAQNQIIETIYRDYQRVLVTERRQHLCDELRTLTGRTSNVDEYQERLYFWTCGYSANVKQKEHGNRNLNRFDQFCGVNSLELVVTLNVTLLSCDLLAFDTLNGQLREDFDKHRERIRKLYQPQSWLDILTGPLTSYPRSCIQMFDSTNVSNATGLNGFVTNGIASSCQMGQVSSTTSSVIPPLRQQQLYNKLLEFSKNNVNSVYNVALIKPKDSAMVNGDVLFSIQAYAQYLLGRLLFTYVTTEHVLVVYEKKNEENFALIKGYAYIDQGKPIKVKLIKVQLDKVAAEHLPICVESWLINQPLMMNKLQ